MCEWVWNALYCILCMLNHLQLILDENQDSSDVSLAPAFNIIVERKREKAVEAPPPSLTVTENSGAQRAIVYDYNITKKEKVPTIATYDTVGNCLKKIHIQLVKEKVMVSIAKRFGFHIINIFNIIKYNSNQSIVSCCLFVSVAFLC